MIKIIDGEEWVEYLNNPPKMFEEFLQEHNKYWTSLGYDVSIKLPTKHVCYMLYKKDEKIVGIMAFNYFVLKDNTINMYLYDLFVHPDYRKQNIATELLERAKIVFEKFCEKLSRESGVLGLRVAINNTKMLNLINKLGFIKGNTHIKVDSCVEIEEEYIYER